MKRYTKKRPFVPNPDSNEGWKEAFNLCREINYPIYVHHENELAKIYPTGHFIELEKDGRPCF